MEARTKVAAAAASVIPFACVICFDEFNATERPPMVLPCGHTYVCLPCTKRLKRCMECREPLFLPAPKPPATNTASGSSYGTSTATGRYSPHLTHQQQPSTPTKQPKSTTPPTPLPIPKNVVLLALMEAAERQKPKPEEPQRQKEAHPKDEEASSDDDSDDDDDSSDDEEEAFNLDHIITGMATLSGPCGTYAVRDPDGLPLYQEDPRVKPPGPPESVMLPEIPTESTNSLLDEEKKQDELILEVGSADQNDQVMNFVLHHNPSMMMESMDILLKGQKVQVVSFEDGVARLARGKGFVRATSRQLVKVGGPLDEACRLEGLLDTVRSRGQDLQKTLEENNEIEQKLRRQLEEAESREPSQPIITDPPAPEVTEDTTTGAPTTPETPLTPPVHRSMSTPDQLESSPSAMHYQHGREQFYTPRTDLGRYIQGGRRAPHSPASIDNSDIMMLPGPAMPRYGSSVSFEEQENYQPYGGGFSCGVGLSLEGAEDLIHRPRPSTPNLGRSHFRSTASPGDSSSLTPSLTSSFDGVDFRTGLSGHRGLSHARKLHHSPKPRSQIRMMGEHRGIAHIRPRREGHGTPTSTSSTVTILENSPTFVTTTSRPHSAVPALGPRFSAPGSSS